MIPRDLLIACLAVNAIVSGCASLPSMPGISAEHYIRMNTVQHDRSIIVQVAAPAPRVLSRLEEGTKFCWTGDVKNSSIQPAGRGVYVPVTTDFRRSTTVNSFADGGGSILIALDGMFGKAYVFGVEIRADGLDKSSAEVFPVPADRRGKKYRNFVAHLVWEGTLFCHHNTDEWSLYVPKDANG